MRDPRQMLAWLFDSEGGLSDRLIPRWIFVRALAAIYFSAFFSLVFQIKGLIGPLGILPAQEYLAAVAHSISGAARFWYAPSLFWISASGPMLLAVTWAGLVASVFAFLNFWPRLNLFVCFVCFLSFVAAASDFSGYQSDGMLLEAGFLTLSFAPGGLRPGLGAADLPSRASYFLLLWEWFRIYFESGLVKLLSGDQQWRHLTAMDDYYQNGPLPTWIGWYTAHLPHWFHVATAGGTLAMELVIAFLLFLPGRARLVCFLIVTPWEISVILTGNYAFLNYLVLALGFLLLDDNVLRRIIPGRFRVAPTLQKQEEVSHSPSHGITLQMRLVGLVVAAILLTGIGYATTAELVGMVLPTLPLPTGPIRALEPFRVANQYGLFAVMTRGRYEIEFQGSDDNQNWTAYPFRYKPQSTSEPPGIYAPYQPRFDWNLWFASLGDWRRNQIVPLTEEHLLANDGDVLSLFRGNPFSAKPPRYVRAVLWQYWFTSREEKRRTGEWWRRTLLGQYAPTLTLGADGSAALVRGADPLPPHD